jgi:hypothetical protein
MKKVNSFICIMSVMMLLNITALHASSYGRVRVVNNTRGSVFVSLFYKSASSGREMIKRFTLARRESRVVGVKKWSWVKAVYRSGGSVHTKRALITSYSLKDINLN